MTAEEREELDRLAECLARAVGETATWRHVNHHIGLPVSVGVRGLAHSRQHETAAAALAELRAILRADTDGAVAAVLDELAALADEGPITAEMLRTMAAARRSQ